MKYPTQDKCLKKEAGTAEQSHDSHYVPEPELFHRVFPFHAVLDEDLSIVQVRARHVSFVMLAVGRELMSLGDGFKLLTSDSARVRLARA